MRFYEEFGLPSDASAEQIKENYRTLVRLLHPDQHADPAVKLAAERQMRRINQIYSVLSDPERRRRYDAESREPERFPIIMPPPLVPPRPMRFTGLIWGAAAVAICGFVLWLAGRDNGYAPQDFVAAKEATDSSSDVGTPRPSEPLSKRVDAASRPAPVGHAEDKPLKTPAPDTGDILASRTVPTAGDASSMSSPPALQNAEPAPPVVSTALTPEPEAAAPLPHFAGAWFYPQSHTANKNPALYPPEYIETMITEEHGTVHGRYRARYQVADRAISPDVVFQFDGRLTAPVANLTWTGAGGARGLIHLKLISESTMEVQWSASELGNAMGLVSGTAILRRRAD